MIKGATIGVLCLALLGCDEATPPADWTFVQLTDNNSWDGHYDTDGRSVVWLSSRFSPDVYLYDGETIRALTTDGRDNWNPKISEGYVVWQAKADFQDVDGPVRRRQYLQFFDGEDTRQIPRSPGVITYNISGKHVAWNGHLGDGQVGIFLFDGEQTHLLAETENSNIYPDVSGTSVVWINRYIFLHDGRGIRRLTTGGAYNQSPRIGGNSVIWSSPQYGEEDEIFLYDGSAILQLTDNEWRDGYPRIGRTHAAWIGRDGNDWEVFHFDGRIVRQITDNEYDDSIPSVSEGSLAWSANPTGARDGRRVFFYTDKPSRNSHLMDTSAAPRASQAIGLRSLWTTATTARSALPSEKATRP